MPGITCISPCAPLGEVNKLPCLSKRRPPLSFIMILLIRSPSGVPSLVSWVMPSVLVCLGWLPTLEETSRLVSTALEMATGKAPRPAISSYSLLVARRRRNMSNSCCSSLFISKAPSSSSASPPSAKATMPPGANPSAGRPLESSSKPVAI